MLPSHLCRRDVPGLDEAILARDYAALEGLDEDEVLASIRVRRILGTLFRDEWYVEAPAFCEERLEQQRQQQQHSRNYRQRPQPEPPPQSPPRRGSSIHLSEEEISHARVLGLRGKITFDDIRKCYRERMQEYHPDKVSSLGPKLRDLADAEAKKINAAYEFFTRKYRRNA
jgi:hypothetical protein